MTLTTQTAAELTDWRRRVSQLYAEVRADPDPEHGHARWRAGRDELFRTHPQTPLLPGDPLRDSGIDYWPYDPTLRFELPLHPTVPTASAGDDSHLSVPTGGDETTELDHIGHLELPESIGGRIDVWWLTQYGGGLFVPLRDGTAGDTSYGGGRYLLDTAKGADLGGSHGAGAAVVVDLNFLYHPSCRYNPEWVCPLAPRGNTITTAIRAGEKL